MPPGRTVLSGVGRGPAGDVLFTSCASTYLAFLLHTLTLEKTALLMATALVADISLFRMEPGEAAWKSSLTISFPVTVFF